MSTIINNPTPQTERTVVTTDSGSWVIVLVLLAVIAAGVYWWIHRGAPVSQTTPTPTVVNVSIPSGQVSPPSNTAP